MSLTDFFPVSFHVKRSVGIELGIEAGVLLHCISENIRIHNSGRASVPIIVNGIMTITKEEAKQECFLSPDALVRAVESIRSGGEDISINTNGDAVVFIPSDLIKDTSTTLAYVEKAGRNNDDGYIYLIRELNEGHVKIGRTVNPSQRIKMFGVQLPFKIDVLFNFKCINHTSAEKQLHREFAELRVGGEWFRLSDKHIEQIKDVAFLKSLGIDVVSAGGVL